MVGPVAHRASGGAAGDGFAGIIAVGESLISAVVDSYQQRHALNAERNALEEFGAGRSIVGIDADAAGGAEGTDVSESMAGVAVVRPRAFLVDGVQLEERRAGRSIVGIDADAAGGAEGTDVS